MEITLEKIELVKDRTGVSYAEAKEALEKAEGSVVDAIILIEEQIDITPKTKAGDQASHIVEKIKELIKKGNVSKIKIKKGDEIIMNIPVNVGILGIVFVPWVTIVSVIAALGAKCSIELVKDNGDVVNLSGKAAETFEEVKSNYSVIADDLKEKSGDALSQVKEKASFALDEFYFLFCVNGGGTVNGQRFQMGDVLFVPQKFGPIDLAGDMDFVYCSYKNKP